MTNTPKYTISDAAALELIEAIVARFPIGEDESIDGADAVDALAEIKDVLDATRFLPKKRS